MFGWIFGHKKKDYVFEHGKLGFKNGNEAPLMTKREQKSLHTAVQDNAEGAATLLMNPHDTTFVGTVDSDEEGHDDVINAIRSVPTHYALDYLQASKMVLEFLLTNPSMKELEAEVWAMVLDWLRHEAVPSATNLSALLTNFKATRQQ